VGSAKEEGWPLPNWESRYYAYRKGDRSLSLMSASPVLSEYFVLRLLIDQLEANGGHISLQTAQTMQ